LNCINEDKTKVHVSFILSTPMEEKDYICTDNQKAYSDNRSANFSLTQLYYTNNLT